MRLPTDSERDLYAGEFQRSIRRGSSDSAAIMTRVLRSVMSVESVCDFGCGGGAWLEAWHNQGVRDLVGIDSTSAGPRTGAGGIAEFRAMDLQEPIRLGRTFDVVTCLEVAEHLATDASERLIESLTMHADVILFSAAPPGQGGTGHQNEQPYEYWRRLFAAREFVPVDYVRQALRDEPTVAPWYRYNTVLYVRRTALGRLSGAARAHQVEDQAALPDVASLTWRLRRALLSRLPSALITRLALTKHHVRDRWLNRTKHR